VVGNDGWESDATDIIGIHDYDGSPARIHDRYGPRADLNDLFAAGGPAGACWSWRATPTAASRSC
jgi:hypothetical protein